MSTGNGGAAIGLANSNKILPIGGLVADTVLPTAGVTYVGDNLSQYWDRNWLGEDIAGPFSVPSCNAGKSLVWVSSGAAQVIVPADGKMAVSGAGVATAAAGSGTFKSSIAPATVIPAGAFFWVESGA